MTAMAVMQTLRLRAAHDKLAALDRQSRMKCAEADEVTGRALVAVRDYDAKCGVLRALPVRAPHRARGGRLLEEMDEDDAFSQALAAQDELEKWKGGVDLLLGAQARRVTEQKACVRERRRPALRCAALTLQAQRIARLGGQF